jgi:predicted DNA-binding transcriptional regulator AlpA
MTKEEFNRLPMMIGLKQVEDCLGIAKATIYRGLDAGQMRHPVKMVGTNRWSKLYIEEVMEKGLDAPGTYPSYREAETRRPLKKKLEPVN